MSKSPSLINFANRADPVTFVRSPTFTNNEFGPIFRGSNPLKRRRTSISGKVRGGWTATFLTSIRVWSGVVPQHPPIRLTESAFRKLAQNFLHFLRRLIVFAECVRQPGIRVTGNKRIRYPGQFLQIRTQFPCAERTVQTDEQRVSVRNRIPEGFGCLARQGSPTCISVIAPEIKIGRLIPSSCRNCLIANIAALAFRVSNTVSISSISAPPSTSPATDSV